MRKNVISLLTLYGVVAGLAAFSEHVDAQTLKISVQISSGYSVIATPTLVVKNGTRASVTVGNEAETTVTGQRLPSSFVNVDLIPTLDGDNNVDVAVNVRTIDEKTVSDQPVKSTRTMELALRLALGRQGSIQLPGTGGAPGLTLYMTIDAIDDGSTRDKKQKD